MEQEGCFSVCTYCDCLAYLCKWSWFLQYNTLESKSTPSNLSHLDHTSFWTDPSDFEDIFDWNLFIETLKEDVRIVKSLPAPYMKIEPLEKALISWSKNQLYWLLLIPILKKT